MQKEPLVSIFLPYYNDENFLNNAIDSIINQTYGNWELFLFNHASNDNSRQIAHSYNDERIRHIDAEKNLGAGSGYNLRITIPKMQGKYVKLLCADDMLKTNALTEMVSCLEQNPDKDILFADMDYVDVDLQPLNTTWSKEVLKADMKSNESETLLKFFQGYSHIAYPAAMIKLEALKDINIDNTLIMLFDVSLWIKLLIAGKKILFYPHSVINYRITENQLSNVANIKLAWRRGYFELFQLLSIFYDIKDVELIKYLCPCEYSKMLNVGDEKYIPFILSFFFASIAQKDRISYFKDQQATREIFGCTKLYHLLQDETYRIEIENKFGFGIREFREVYSFLPNKKNKKISIKQKIYSKCGKDLSVLQLIYLLLRKMVRLINPTYYIHKIKRKLNIKKQYTV